MATVKLPAQVALLRDQDLRGALERSWEELGKLEDTLIACEARLTVAEAQAATIPALVRRLRQLAAEVQRFA